MKYLPHSNEKEQIILHATTVLLSQTKSHAKEVRYILGDYSIYIKLKNGQPNL